MLEDIQRLGASLVAISPQLPQAGQVTAEKNGLTFRLLSDRGNAVAKRFGLVFALPPELREFYLSLGIDLAAFNGDESFELPLTATYLIGRDGVVRNVVVDADYVKRMEPADIVAGLRAMR